MATETLGDAAGKAAESGGLPQLDLSTFPNQIFWLVITLVAIYLILTRVSLPRIAATLGERQGTIMNDLAKAEDMKAQAAQAEAAYNKALAEAKAEAQRIAAAARAEIQADLDKAIAKADAEISAKAAESEKAIAAIRAGAMDSVRAVATETAAEIAAAMGVSADAKDIEVAVAARVKG